MRIRGCAVRAVAFGACLLVLGGACSSSDKTADPSNAATSTTRVSQRPNPIPFDVGERVGLPKGWLVQVTRVQRPYTNGQLPDLADNREYLAVDIWMQNRGTETRTVDSAELFHIGDSTGALDAAVAVPGESNDLDGDYEPQTERSGQLVFDVPTKAQLRLAMNGPLIGTQNAIFMVDPPTVGPAD